MQENESDKEINCEKIDTLQFAAAGTGNLQHGSEACVLCGTYGDKIKDDEIVPKLYA